MKILIIGENIINKTAENYFSQKGIDTVTLPDVMSIRKFSGEVGNFTLNTTDSEYKTDYIILAEHPAVLEVELNGLQVKSIYTDALLESGADNLSATKAKAESILFLLDYFCESSASATVYALKSATLYAKKKRPVYYFTKTIKTAGIGIEELYADARSAGVNFVKYKDIQIKSDLENDVLAIRMSDDKTELKFNAKNIYSDSDSGFSEEFNYLKKKLNLKSGTHGFLNEDSYFLTPTQTSRNGVFYLSPDVVALQPEYGLDSIYSHISISNNPTRPALEIDGKKCIFCYNCYRTCPHAALAPDLNENQMTCLKNACQSCGACISICPAKAITIAQEDSSPTTPALRATPPKRGINAQGDGSSVLLCCENSAIDAISSVQDINYTIIPCGGYVDTNSLSEKLKHNDNITIVVCPDDACRHFDGNKRACSAAKRLSKQLETAGVSNKKIKIIKASNAMPNILLEELSK